MLSGKDATLADAVNLASFAGIWYWSCKNRDRVRLIFKIPE